MSNVLALAPRGQLKAALYYVESLAWPVFPCRRDKRPMTANGFLDAVVDHDQVRTWWTESPEASIGIPTGPRSMVWVLDVDQPDGPAALAALEEKHGPLPATVEQQTGGGGRQFFFKWHDGLTIRNSAKKIGAGLDVRGDGGYVIVPPSGHPSGNTYAWARGRAPWDHEIADAPAWLVELVSKSEQKPTTTTKHNNTTKYGGAALARELADLAGTPEGQRNEHLNRSAFSMGQLVAGGELEHVQAEAGLIGMGTSIGLPHGEVVKTVKSGIEAGLKEPRTAPQEQPRRRPSPLPAPSGVDDLVGFAPTEDGIALAFESRFENELRFDHHAGTWFHWDGTRWRREETDLAFAWARGMCREINAHGKANLARAATAAGVERFTRAARCFAVTSEIWDLDPFLLGTPGGTVDLRTGIIRPAKQGDCITKSTAVAPAEFADCPQWETFLDQATRGDKALVRFLRQVAGYCLTGDIREHALFFVHGPGGNGKGVFLNTMTNILADYATTAAMDTFVASHNDKHPTDLAMLKSARMVCASETEEGRRWAESRIKQLTGGDRISARFMRQDFFQYKPEFKLVIIGNHQPVLANVDDAARRRFNIIPFIHKPATPDPQLEDKLQAEYPGILRWMLDGCLDWQIHGLVRPEVVLDATQNYFDDQDLFGRWIEESCDTGPRKWEPTGVLFASWQRFAKANGEEAGSAKAFNANLVKRGFTPERKKVFGEAKRAFRGLAIREQHQEEDHRVNG